MNHKPKTNQGTRPDILLIMPDQMRGDCLSWPLADTLHPTDWTVAESRKAVADADADRPLFLTTSFYAPHPPLFPPRQYLDAYRQHDLPEPAHGDWVEWESLAPEGDRNGHRVLLE